MAQFAEINEQGIVQRVIVVSNSKLTNYTEPLTQAQSKEIDILKKLGGEWVQTSYNRNFRGNFAGVGFSYLSEHDIFMPPKPFKSWTLNVEKAKWEAPKPMPTEGEWYWNEQKIAWEKNRL